jgi:hypothetical protein
MIDGATIAMLSAGTGIGMAAGLWMGFQQASKRFNHMAYIMTKTTGALVSGCHNILVEELKCTDLEAAHKIIRAATKQGFIGGLRNPQTGEPIHDDETDQK